MQTENRRHRQETTINGNPMPASVIVGEGRLKLITRAVSIEEFRAAFSRGKAFSEMAKQFDVTTADVVALAAYLELERTRIPGSLNKSAVDLDILADRMLEKLDPRIRKLVADAIEAALK